MIRMTRINVIKCDNEAIKPERVKTEIYIQESENEGWIKKKGK